MSMMDDRTPLLNDAPEATKEAPGHGQYGFWVCVCFTINYVIGVGILDIPYAFSQSGLVFGIVIALVSGGMILMTLVWVVEVMGRSMGWTAVLLAKSIDRRDNAVGQLERDPEHADTTPRDASVRALAAILQDKTPAQVLRETLEAPREEVQALLDAYDRSGSISSASINSGATSDLLNPATEHQALIFEDGAPKKVGFDLCDPKVERAFEALGGKYYEINEMLDIFAPAWAKIGWEIALAMLLYLALWAYASVFGESVLAKFPIFAWSNGCGDDYSNACMWSFRLVVVIYGVIVVTLTCMEFTEMVWYQVAMTGARFGLIFLILFTCVIGLGTNPVDNGSTKEHAPYTQEFYTWEWSGLVPILSATVFAQLVLFGMPALLTPLKNKAQSVRVMVTASFTTTFFYILLGIFTVLYFGNTLKSPINKNYTDYSGGDRNGTRWWAYIIEYFCTLFPAVDVLSIFPLLGVALGNSLRAFAIRWSPWMKRKDAETKWVRIGCRLLAAIPPIFGSFILRDLSKILIYTSIPSLWLAFVGPVCLNYFSIRKCRMYGVDPNTPYTIKHLSGTPGMTVSIVFAVVCYILMVGNLISSSFPA